jgi:hypothetical protein
MHERNTRTLDPADYRRRSSAAPSGATGQAAAAVCGRGVGGDCRRDHFHLVGHLLLRRHNPRASPLPPLSPRHVQTRRSGWSRRPVGRPAGGVRTVAARLPRRTGWPRHGSSAFRWTWWSGRPVRRSDRSGWSRPVADDRLSGSRPVAAPLAVRDSVPISSLFLDWFHKRRMLNYVPVGSCDVKLKASEADSHSRVGVPIRTSSDLKSNQPN